MNRAQFYPFFCHRRSTSICIRFWTRNLIGGFVSHIFCVVNFCEIANFALLHHAVTSSRCDNNGVSEHLTPLFYFVHDDYTLATILVENLRFEYKLRIPKWPIDHSLAGVFTRLFFRLLTQQCRLMGRWVTNQRLSKDEKVTFLILNYKKGMV